MDGGKSGEDGQRADPRNERFFREAILMVELLNRHATPLYGQPVRVTSAQGARVLAFACWSRAQRSFAPIVRVVPLVPWCRVTPSVPSFKVAAGRLSLVYSLGVLRGTGGASPP